MNILIFNLRTIFSRYHLDEEQKYGHFSPGKISEKLKKALNIGENELPSYIYHMRRLGYPPGWLENAKITSSNIKLFDFHGSSISNNQFEEFIDQEKIVEYPGFNMPLEKGCKDVSYNYFCVYFNYKNMLIYKYNISASVNIIQSYPK